MKLYTEDQIRESLNHNFNFGDRAIEFALSKLTPIELPSDDEVCDEAESIAHNYFVMQRNHYQGLDEGAKRMAYWFMKRFKQQDDGST